jgi:H+/Cl- antiporter ClcA
MEQPKENWKMTTMLIGAVIGLICGLIGAYIIIQRAEEEESHPRLTAGDGVKMGIGVLGVLRTVADLTVKR